MTLPTVIRIFFAIELPETIKKAIGDYISALKKKSKHHAIRWTRNENLHITLQFIGETKSDDLSKLTESVHKRIESSIKPFNINVKELFFFPNPFRPRVIVLNIEPQKDLAKLAELIGQGVLAEKYSIDDRDFRGHLTLGRIKQPKGLDLSYLSENPLPELLAIEVNEVVLYRSEPQIEGSIYTVLERLKF